MKGSRTRQFLSSKHKFCCIYRFVEVANQFYVKYDKRRVKFGSLFKENTALSIVISYFQLLVLLSLSLQYGIGNSENVPNPSVLYPNDITV